MDEIGIEKARASLGEIVERARLLDEPTLITRHGMPAAYVVSTKWFEANRPILELHYEHRSGGTG